MKDPSISFWRFEIKVQGSFFPTSQHTHTYLKLMNEQSYQIDQLIKRLYGWEWGGGGSEVWRMVFSAEKFMWELHICTTFWYSITTTNSEPTPHYYKWNIKRWILFPFFFGVDIVRSMESSMLINISTSQPIWQSSSTGYLFSKRNE